MLPLISFTLGLSFLSGLNLYLATFLTSLAVQQGWIDPALHPAVAALGHPAVLLVALLLFLTEFIVDKIPWVDSVWDAVHTVIRPAGAVMLSLVMLNGAALTSDAATAALAVLAGGIALGTHLTKSGVRLLINASPEPFTNILASLAEDLAVVGLLLLLINAPVTGFATCLALLAGTWIVLPRLMRLVKTSVWLMWKKFFGNRTAGLPHHGVLPAALTVAQETQLRPLLEVAVDQSAPAAAWAVPCITGKIRHIAGLRANRSGTLVAPADHPGVLVFLYRGWFRRGAVRLPLAGCTIRQETTMLSENLVIHHAADGLHFVFRFTRSEGALVARLVADLRRRLGLDAPTLLSSTSRALPLPVMPPLPEPAAEVWNAPGASRH